MTQQRLGINTVLPSLANGEVKADGGTKEKKGGNSEIAYELAKKQREISVAEFFEKNRHLLGFDNKRKALLTTVKEAVDNAIDAAEEAKILPEVHVEMIDMGKERFRIVIEDNGPGIVKNQVPNIFAKLLYGSKFHSLKQSRGQQGIGISAAALYGQLTTGRPIRIKSKVGPTRKAHYFELHIDTRTNKPEIVKQEEMDWHKEHGTRIELDLEGAYQKGLQSVDEYLKETAIVNPHLTIIYTSPKAEQFIFARVSEKVPPEAKEIKPHPYGIELGMLIKMTQWTPQKSLQSFFTAEFSRVSSTAAKEICEKAGIPPKSKPNNLNRAQVERLMEAIKKTKLMNPPTDCISPISAPLVELGMKKEINAEFYTAVTRPPNVYRGNPFSIEVGLAYGGELPKDKTVRLMRFANRVPLLYQQGGCAVTQCVTDTNWRSYGLSQSQNALPVGAVVILVHIASVWTPYTSEAKEAIAHYPEIMKEIRLAIQEAGRKLGSYIKKKKRIKDEFTKRSFIEKYIPHVANALRELLEYSKTEEENVQDMLKDILEKKRGKLDKMEFDPKKNIYYDEEFAKIGKDEKPKDEWDEFEKEKGGADLTKFDESAKPKPKKEKK